MTRVAKRAAMVEVVMAHPNRVDAKPRVVGTRGAAHGPVEVVADIEGGLTMRDPIALDALLMSSVALAEGLPPLSALGPEDPRAVIEIPIARSECGRVYLASSVIVDGWDGHERRFVNRKFPLAEAQALGNDRLRRIRIGAGAQKSYRIPEMVAFPQRGELRWYALGDEEEIRPLLALATHLGHRRAMGRGRVLRWTVAPCEPWDGFPVVRDGMPLRTLPADWPGLSADAPRAYAVLEPPYWERWRREPCAVPVC